MSRVTAPTAAPAVDASHQHAAARVRAAGRPAVERSNPTFGAAYWALGVLAAFPALLCAAVFLARDLRLPRVPPADLNLLLAVLVVALALGSLVAHHLAYPAWSQPLATALPVVTLFLPAAVLHGQELARANGDPDPIVAAPALITWLLLVMAATLTAAWGLIVGRHAPSFCGVALAPLPVVLAWTLALATDFRDVVVVPALASAFTLIALMTFVAWIVPAAHRPFVPLGAIGAQLAAFWALRLRWPEFGGAVRPVVGLDLALFAALVLLVGLAPVGAAWMRRAGWPELRRLLGR